MDLRQPPPPLRLLEKPARRVPPRPVAQPPAQPGWWQRFFGALAR
jgi:hypothetical protein